MVTNNTTQIGWRKYWSNVKGNLCGCLFNKRVEPPLADQDSGLQRIEEHWKELNNRLGLLEGGNPSEVSEHNMILMANEIQGLHDRVAGLETTLAEQKSLFQKLISDFTKLEETHWCSISSVASSHSPKSVGSDMSDNHTDKSGSSELTEINELFGNDSIDSSSDSEN